MSASPVYVGSPKHFCVQLLNADSTNLKSFIPDQNTTTKIVALYATADEAKVVQIYLTRGGTDFLMGTTSITANAGVDGTVATANLFDTIPGLAVDNDGQKYFIMEDNDVLKVKATVAVTSLKTVTIHADAGNKD